MAKPSFQPPPNRSRSRRRPLPQLELRRAATTPGVDTLRAVSYNRRSCSQVCHSYSITMENRMSHLTPFPPRSSSHGLWRGVVALACLMLLLTGMAAPAGAAARAASQQLPRSSPEAQGIASSDILAFVRAADEQVDTMNSFMLVRHGHVVAEGYWSPYDAQTRHALYSLSKSFTSTAVGLAMAEGK